MDLAQHIIEREKALLHPETRKSQKRLCELISTEFKEIGASGSCFGLAEVLDALPHENGWSATTQDWEFRLLSEELAQTIHRAFVVRHQGDSGTYSLRSSIWRLEDGDWKMVYHKGTKVASEGVDL